MGKVIDEEELKAMPGVQILSQDSLYWGRTQTDGTFKIELPAKVSKLILDFIGMERTTLDLPSDCHNLEVIMMTDIIYDFVPIETVNKKRYRRFKALKSKHRQAFKQGTFQNDKPCMSYVFEK